MHRVRGASGGVLAREPGLPQIAAPARPPRHPSETVLDVEKGQHTKLQHRVAPTNLQAATGVAAGVSGIGVRPLGGHTYSSSVPPPQPSP